MTTREPGFTETHRRRSFLKKFLAMAAGALSAFVPPATGFLVLCDPLRRRGSENRGLVRITTLEALPEDGTPRQFAVQAAATDAWNKYLLSSVGAIYLRRVGPTSVEALNVVCPHAGCFVEFNPANRDFRCPCHGSRFAPDGQILDARSPSPRGLDRLELEIRDGKEIWVRFQNFETGQKDKIPLA
jgi:menaquinol-cytochrome c reductase iron-sulfur subunit